MYWLIMNIPRRESMALANSHISNVVHYNQRRINPRAWPAPSQSSVGFFGRSVSRLWTRKCCGNVCIRRCGAATTSASGKAEGEGMAEMEHVKIAVGPSGSCIEQLFSFRRMFGPSSVLVVVTLAKPLGIIFRSMEGSQGGLVVVEGLVPRSNADRCFRTAQMFRSNVRQRRGGVIVGDIRPGDVLRASTTVVVTVDLFGLRAPRRVVEVFQADGRPWRDTMAALNASFVADGPVTLVLERTME